MAASNCQHLLVVFVCFLYSIHEIWTLSGGFYADNERQQSVLFEPLAKRQRRELEDEILNLLGLDRRPRPKHHDKKSSAPKYLIDLYQSFDTEAITKDSRFNTSRRMISDSDVIVSFVNKIHHKSPHLRHEKDRRFYFDVSEIPPEEEIVKAELRIYREHLPPRKKSHHQQFTLSLFEVNEDAEISLEPVDEILVTEYDEGWLVFNVTGPIMDWIAFPSKNSGLYLKIKINGSNEASTPQEVGIIGPKGPEEKQPFMVAYFKTPTHPHIRKPRAAKKRMQESYYDSLAVNPYSGLLDKKNPSRRSCQRWTLYVSFKDLGWHDWIIAPDGYPAFYCHGQCSFPLNANMNATNHAIVQTLVHLMDPSVVPKPCCAPTQLSAITVLYFDDNSNVILKKYKNMVVKSCGCH